MLKGSHAKNFIATKVEELVTQKHREGPDEHSVKFCTGTDTIHNICAEHLDEWVKHIEDFFLLQPDDT